MGAAVVAPDPLVIACVLLALGGVVALILGGRDSMRARRALLVRIGDCGGSASVVSLAIDLECSVLDVQRLGRELEQEGLVRFAKRPTLRSSPEQVLFLTDAGYNRFADLALTEVV